MKKPVKKVGRKRRRITKKSSGSPRRAGVTSKRVSMGLNVTPKSTVSPY